MYRHPTFLQVTSHQNAGGRSEMTQEPSKKDRVGLNYVHMHHGSPLFPFFGFHRYSTATQRSRGIRCNPRKLGVTRFTLIMVICLCQCGLHAMLWSHIGILMRLLAAEPRSTGELLFPCQCICGKILPALYSMVWDWLVLRAGPMILY